jgi:hypothetical protein
VKKQKYALVGMDVRELTITEPVLYFFSIMGNSHVAKPAIVTTNHFIGQFGDKYPRSMLNPNPQCLNSIDLAYLDIE